MRLLLASLLLSLSGCLLYFHEGDKQCAVDTTGPAEPAQSLRNPDLLTCEAFGGGGGTCDPACGPCPDLPTTGGAALIAPPPSWGTCGSTCEGLDEFSCSDRTDCRVVRDVRCAIDQSCQTDFLGCFPTDQIVDRAIDCFAASSGDACSRNPDCTAYHRNAPCTPSDPGCVREFSLCMPAGLPPGRCFEPTICDIPSPPCPVGTIPGVADGCYTGACIPEQDCEGFMARRGSRS